MCHKKANFLQKTFSIKSFNSMLLTFELKEKLKFEYLIKIKKKLIDNVSMKIRNRRKSII